MCKMKKIFTAAFVCILLAVSTLSISAFAVNGDDIIILYENDVHCSVESPMIRKMLTFHRKATCIL